MRAFTIVTLLAVGLVACATAPSESSHSAPGAETPGESVEIDGSGTSVVTSEEAGITSATRLVSIDLEHAVALDVGSPGDLAPATFKTPDGRRGWAVKIPGGRPIATPAYAGGVIFVGGGYGSHEFYALDAATGAVRWKLDTKDDGPSAAVVEDGLVAFNTESCTVVVAEAATGKVVWQEWLGDPLMSQPAIARGRLFIAYPKAGHGHHLLCADLKTGKHVFEVPITGDIISAPVLAWPRVYFTCFDGTSFCVDAAGEKEVWRRRNAGTSAPLVVGEKVIVTNKAVKGGASFERLASADLNGNVTKTFFAERAGYLGRGRAELGLPQESAKSLDGAVGFGSAPAAANLDAADKNLGTSTVAAAWAFQGSRACYGGGQIMNAQGANVNCVRDGKLSWRAQATGDGQVFSPPALGAKNLYLASGRGHLLAVDQATGEARFAYATGQPICFQPALAGGSVFVGTSNGLVICLETGSADADGWTAWGGNAQHNLER
jgi:Ca-activated chloride channel family protein